MGIKISPLCDRKTTNIPQSQIGFISYIIEPTYAILTEASHFVATEFLPVVLEEEKTTGRISTEKKFKVLRSADVKLVIYIVTSTQFRQKTEYWRKLFLICC